MNVRTIENSVVRKASAALKRFNDRHPWSHNDHFHGWMMRRLPRRRRTAVDVGCGRGELVAKLGERFGAVVGIDIDAEMRAVTARRCSALANVRVSDRPLAEVPGDIDLITMIATLHHLDAADVFRTVRRLLAPGGRLLVVGLVPPVSRRDIAWDIVSIVTNPLIGLIKHPRAVGEPAGPPPFPVKDPAVPYDELRRIAADLLPGARLRHRVGFRYTLEWTKPPRGRASSSG